MVNIKAIVDGVELETKKTFRVEVKENPDKEIFRKFLNCITFEAPSLVELQKRSLKITIHNTIAASSIRSR